MDRAASKSPASDIAEVNRTFYDALWSKAYLQRPDRFNTWPMVSEVLPGAPERLEIGPGMRPRLPVAGTYFIDISAPAVAQLNAGGGIAQSRPIGALPFEDERFDLVCAFDVIEHVEDDQRVFAEMARVAKDNGTLILSVPVHAEFWTEFDDWVGHARRYDPQALKTLLAAHGFEVVKSAAFGMKPANPRLVSYGMSYLERHPTWAMFWYNWVAMPLALRFQKPLTFVDGLIENPEVDEMVVVCRRRSRVPAATSPAPAR